MQEKHAKMIGFYPTRTEPVPAVRAHWLEWKAAAGRRSLQTRCPVWSCAATTNKQ